MKQLEVRSAGLSDRGLIRSDNQDQFLVADLTRSMLVQSGSLGPAAGSRLFGGPLGYLFFVADGMGGHKAGNEASLLAIEYFVNAVLNSTRWLVHTEPMSQGPFIEDLKTMLLNAHRMIQGRSECQPELKGMGTTLTLAYVAWPKMFVVHAGDTRCYLVNGGQLKLLTNDHTVANQMMKTGQLDPEALERSPWSNVLVNALGAGAEQVFAEIHEIELRSGDTLLLCSDGLNKHVSDQKIQEVLRSQADPNDVCKSLVEMAKNEGGSDNVTVVVARFEETRLQSPPRMKIMAAATTNERILQDVEMPEADMDTMVDMITDEYFAKELGDDKDTGDFSENSDGHPTAEYSPKE